MSNAKAPLTYIMNRINCLCMIWEPDWDLKYISMNKNYVIILISEINWKAKAADKKKATTTANTTWIIYNEPPGQPMVVVVDVKFLYENKFYFYIKTWHPPSNDIYVRLDRNYQMFGNIRSRSTNSSWNTATAPATTKNNNSKRQCEI